MTKTYYKKINSINPNMDFKQIHKAWFWCYKTILKSFSDFSDKSIKSLFYDFEMQNWKALHQENTEYKNLSKKDLIKRFCSEINYASDRMSYDRLFRCHWLFLRAFEEEITDFRFPELKKYK